MQLPAAQPERGDRAAGRGGEQRFGHAESRGGLAPEQTSDAQRSEHDGDVEGEASAAHPLGQGGLGRGVKAGQAGDPGDARDGAGQERDGGGVGQAEQGGRGRGAERAGDGQPIRAEPGVQPRQGERAADRRGADDPEQHAIERRTAGDLGADDQGQQRPVGAGEDEETGAADQGRTQWAAEAGVAHAGANRRPDVLGRQAGASPMRRPPPHHGEDDPQVGHCIDDEGRGDAEHP